MRRIALLAVSSLALLFIIGLAPSRASALFTQCPPVDLDAGCQFLFTVTDAETTVESDPTQGPYEGADDALIGIVNNSSKALSSIPLSAEIELFGFEFDGICSVTKPAPGCVVLPRNPEGNPNPNKGNPCPPESFGCGFPPPPEEPPGVKFPEAVESTIVGRGENGDPVSGYEGPRTWFSGIGAFGSFPTGSGVVNFSPPLAPGESTYFSLESPPTGGFGSATTLTTTLSGGGQSGPSIGVAQGTPVTDTATLGGAGASTATGTVTFALYSDPECKNLVTAAGSAKLSAGTAGPSGAVTPAIGKYYWQARYGGNNQNQGATSACGTEILTVLSPTTITTTQSGGGIKGAKITVPSGTAVTDSARISGAQAAASTGAVSYVLYRDKACTKPAIAAGSGSVLKGAARPSSPVKPGVGTYYWRASYSGDSLNAPSVSTCGAEVLVVAKKASLGLKKFRGCVSKRHFVVHPRAPHGVTLVKVEEFINGRHVLTGKLTRRHTTVDLRGLRKGTYKVELIAKSSKGQVFEDTRTFHTCVKKKRHKLK